MAIAADDATRLPFNGAFDHPVVIGIIDDSVQDSCGLDDSGDARELGPDRQSILRRDLE